MRLFPVFFLAFAACQLHSQTPPAPMIPGVAAVPAAAPAEPAEPARAGGRSNQRVELIRIEDGGSRIDEVRYAGQTQSITVQPKARMPEYEFQPMDMTRSRPADHRAGLSSAAGQRVWNVLKF